jgi:hypothetical protein
MKLYLIYFTNKYFSVIESALSLSDLKTEIFNTYGVPVEHINLYEVGKTQYLDFMSRNGGKVIEHVNGEIKLVETQNVSEIVQLNGVPTEVLNTQKVVLETLSGIQVE